MPRREATTAKGGPGPIIDINKVSDVGRLTQRRPRACSLPSQPVWTRAPLFAARRLRRHRRCDSRSFCCSLFPGASAGFVSRKLRRPRHSFGLKSSSPA